ncbi:response regulator [Aridibaculum aurantiacum]|uniref:response regulator n=1 Tax=Aridibaculum aurantiacum TaxID=2810307 RepID=UPI001A95C7B7|nr:response regulator [Aridibaculum aurantiacum]
MTDQVAAKNIVLYADDDTDDLELVAEAFSKYRNHVDLVTVTDGLQALSFLKNITDNQKVPCLVILDINMPRLNGRETLLRIREMDKYDNVPAILFSTSSQPFDKDFAAANNAGFITKPLDYRQMDIIAEQFIEHCSDEVKKKLNNLL